MMGSPRRASTNLRYFSKSDLSPPYLWLFRTNTERLMDAEPSNTRAIVRLPPQASRGQPSGPVLNTARDHPVEVPNVRRPARYVVRIYISEENQLIGRKKYVVYSRQP